MEMAAGRTPFLFGRLGPIADARVSLQYPVFAVWDSFALLKRLRREVTCVDVP